ncbi:hypothetical protein GF367_01270 [Candidatus Woesearchaeota archaeon]|nr:hypothetical protein [Candidatus Woesearchaeota archaeon]
MKKTQQQKTSTILGLIFLFVLVVLTFRSGVVIRTNAEAVAHLARQYAQKKTFIEIAPGGAGYFTFIWEVDDMTITYRTSPVSILEIKDESIHIKDCFLDDEYDSFIILDREKHLSSAGGCDVKHRCYQEILKTLVNEH